MKPTTARMIRFSRRLRSLPLDRRRYAASLRSLGRRYARRVYLEAPLSEDAARRELLIGAGVPLYKLEAL